MLALLIFSFTFTLFSSIIQVISMYLQAEIWIYTAQLRIKQNLQN